MKTHFPVILRSWTLEGRVRGERSQARLEARWVTTAMLLSHQLLGFEAAFKEFLLHWRGISECEVRLLFFFFPLLVSNLRHLLSTLGPSASEHTISLHT